jgi:hypothetical protein
MKVVSLIMIREPCAGNRDELVYLSCARSGLGRIRPFPILDSLLFCVASFVTLRQHESPCKKQVCGINRCFYSCKLTSTGVLIETGSSQAHIPPNQMAYLTYAELVEFLQNQAQSANLCLVCPLPWEPLPSIDLNLDASAGKYTKAESSLRTSEALITYSSA